MGSLVLDSQQNYLASNVYCLDASTGAKVWNYTTQGGVNSSPAIAGDYVYVGGWDNNFYCLNASSGEQIWKYATQGHINSSPAIANGIVYIGSWDHKIYAFGVQPAADTPLFNLSQENTYLIVAAISAAIIIAAIIVILRRQRSKSTS